MSYLSQNIEQLFPKYSDDELRKECICFKKGGKKLDKTINHFFKEAIYKCKSNRYKKSPYEAMLSDDDMYFILEYIKTKPSFYSSKSEIKNVESFFRNGTRIARKVANFSPDTARNIYFKYFNTKHISCLDTSSGFGQRLQAVVLSGGSYTGIEPSKDIFLALQNFKDFLISQELVDSGQEIILFNCGSEDYINSICEKFDVSFTSPPYFNLESYSNDNYESTKNYNNYQKWKEKFVIPTIQNTYTYLKNGGYAIINTKNLTYGGKERLFDDWFSFFKSHNGFEYVEVFEMKHQNSKNFWKNTNYRKENYIGFKEPVMSFKKVVAYGVNR